jgi:hypothetical protein
VDRWLSPDLDVIELGSSIGVVSSHIRRRLNPERRLIWEHNSVAVAGTLSFRDGGYCYGPKV